MDTHNFKLLAMKYIDVEKLKDEIKGLQCEQGFEDGETERGYQVAIKDILRVIDSLQQEQEQYVIGGQVFGATDIEQLYKGKVYIVSKSLQDKEFGIYPGKRVKMLLIKD